MGLGKSSFRRGPPTALYLADDSPVLPNFRYAEGESMPVEDKVASTEVSSLKMKLQQCLQDPGWEESQKCTEWDSND